MEYILLLQILITEVHSTPAGGEPEWVECVVSSQGAVRLDEFILCDNRTCVGLPPLRLLPGQLFLVTRDGEALHETRVIGKDVSIAECVMPSLNNTTDRVEIRRRDSSIVDMVTYKMVSNERGRSIERHGNHVEGHVAYSSTWSASTAFDSATCGRINSHVEYEHDVALTGHYVQDSILHIGVFNSGRIDVPAHNVTISIGQQRYTKQCPPLQAKQWWSAQLELMQLMPGDYARDDVVTVQIGQQDMRMENNTYVSGLTVPPMNGNIMITEILADPNDRDADFVEVWNGTEDTINIADWTVQDQSGEVCRVVGTALIAPKSYMACSSDTAIMRMVHGRAYALLRPVLNVHAQQDTVFLRTNSGFIVDKAPYDRAWHSPVLRTAKGRSLEKRVPRSIAMSASDWSTSTDMTGSTPGAKNSIDEGIVESTASLIAMPSPFSVLPTAARHPCVISWLQPFEQAQARLFIYKIDGSMVAELLNGAFVGRQGAVTWNGLHADTQAPLAIGIYIAAMECIDANSDQVVRATCPVVIGQTH